MKKIFTFLIILVFINTSIYTGYTLDGKTFRADNITQVAIPSLVEAGILTNEQGLYVTSSMQEYMNQFTVLDHDADAVYRKFIDIEMRYTSENIYTLFSKLEADKKITLRQLSEITNKYSNKLYATRSYIGEDGKTDISPWIIEVYKEAKREVNVLNAKKSVNTLTEATIANAMDYSKGDACRLKDGYYEKSLSVVYPGYTASTYEFIKKGGKLVYFVQLGEDIIDKVYAYEYNCSTKKTKQIGDLLKNTNMSMGLEGLSNNWIIGHIIGDACAYVPNMQKTLINRMNGNQKIVIFSGFTGYNSIFNKFNFQFPKEGSVWSTDNMGIKTFGSTPNPDIFNAVLIRNGGECGDGYTGEDRIIRVVVDVSKKTMKLR